MFEDMYTVPVISMVVVIVVILVLIWFYLHCSDLSSKYSEFIGGFWEADPEFCKESEITRMWLMVGPVDNDKSTWSKTVRNCYIVIMQGQNSVMNDVIIMKYSTPYHVSDHYVIDVDISCSNKTDDLAIPSECSFEFNIINGSLLIYKDKTIYGLLYRNNLITNNISDVNKQMMSSGDSLVA